MNTVGHARPRADGFPLAPLIEAVVDINFQPALEEPELEEARRALGAYYSTFSATPFHEFKFDVDSGTVDVVAPRNHYRGVADDTTELSLLRPEGLGASQLAPYREWEDLYGRFRRDLDTFSSTVGARQLTRMAVRSINRIDVPPVNGLIQYEDYLTIYPRVPDEWTTIDDFQLQISREVPAIEALAKIVVKRHPPIADSCASFFLDIDVARAHGIPQDFSELDALFQEFRKAKNEIYRSCLTPRALKEFEQ